MADITEGNIRKSIKDILLTANLNELTAKSVRKQLEEKYGVSLLERKEEIDKILMVLLEQQNETESSDEEKPSINNLKANSKDLKSQQNSKRSIKNKQGKRSRLSKENIVDSSDSEDGNDDSENGLIKGSINDEEIAMRLQESVSGLRRRKQPVKRQQANTEKKERKKSKGNGFTKEMVLSPQLTSLLGQDKMCRSDVVKQMWVIIKERNLGDPKNKRYTLCDEQLQSIFGRKRFLTFGMMKYLKNHVRDPELIA